MASQDEFVIFYAWQSDTNGNHGRHLIQEALEEAKDAVAAEGSFPFAITITSDTKGEPGLCDIPAAILAKIKDADAIVVDLSFIASTDSESPKFCSNPNVLFELGYAFDCLGPERVIAVMNEAHGPANATLFDIAHRRYPIRYTSPKEGAKRSETVATLVKELVAAIKLVAAQGPRGTVTDSESNFLKQEQEIVAGWRRYPESNPSKANASFLLRPTSYRERRYPNVESVVDQIRNVSIRYSGHARVDANSDYDVVRWGLLCSNFGMPFWAFSYEGVLWQSVAIDGYGDRPRGFRAKAMELRGGGPIEALLGNQDWVDYIRAKEEIRDMVWHAARYARQLSPGENLFWRFRVEGLEGKWLGSSSAAIPLDNSRPAVAADIEISGYITAGDFKSSWIDLCARCLAELFVVFDLMGRRIDESTMRDWLLDWQKQYKDLP